MRALILAAGRGERMRPLSDATPKPLLRAGGRSLIEWQLAALARAGIRDIVINVAHLGGALRRVLGNGADHGVRIAYSVEGEHAEDALETRGGIARALPLLGESPFVVTSGDVVTDFDYAALRRRAEAIAGGAFDAHFVLVDNPPSHPAGDMALADGRATRAGAPRLTYGNIGVFAPRLFAAVAATRERLFPWMYDVVDAGRVSAEHYAGRWFNVGTPAELAALDDRLNAERLGHSDPAIR